MPIVRSRFVTVVLAACLGLSLLPSVAAADTDGPVRLLVTYAGPMDAASAELVTTAAVVADGPAASSVQVLEFPSAAAARAAATDLAARGDVLAVEPDRPLRAGGSVDRILDVVVEGTVTTAGSTSSLTTDATTATTSELDSSSWGVDNQGQEIQGVAGRAGIDVGARQSWTAATGDGIVVAVIDTGVDGSHPLLRDHMWRNPAEDADGIDNDGNGYVDDLHGWDFVNDSPEVYRSATLDAHGTHVAGVIAGSAHADTGFTGVAPAARIMPLKFIEGSQGSTSDAIAAIRYAEANGADVINASWGSTDPSEALRTVLAETTIPVVLSAGNLGHLDGAPPAYPARYGLANVISVAAIDNTGQMPAFSSRSQDVVDVAAPGARILGPSPDERLAEVSGTSQAAPHVAGLLALALQRHPGLDPVALARAVRDTVRPLHGADETRSGGLARGPGLLDHLGTSMPACLTLPEMPFEDVTPGGAHHDAVACMLALGVTSGTSATTYGSADGLSRAQIATLLANALEPTGQLPPAPATARFDDVSSTNVHRDNIERLAAIGIVTGTAANLYEPARTVTRAEFAAAVARADEWLAGADIRAIGAPFADTAGHADEGPILKAAGLRIISGRSADEFAPDVSLRRDQAASMVSRMLDRMVQQGLLDAAA